jgi:hypothetical protein
MSKVRHVLVVEHASEAIATVNITVACKAVDREDKQVEVQVEIDESSDHGRKATFARAGGAGTTMDVFCKVGKRCVDRLTMSCRAEDGSIEGIEWQVYARMERVSGCGNRDQRRLLTISVQ